MCIRLDGIPAWVDTLSLAPYAPRITARLLIVHSRADAKVPFTEALSLSRNLPLAPPPRVVIVSLFEHMDLKLEWRSLDAAGRPLTPGTFGGVIPTPALDRIANAVAAVIVFFLVVIIIAPSTLRSFPAEYIVMPLSLWLVAFWLVVWKPELSLLLTLSMLVYAVAGWLGRQDDLLPDLTPCKWWGNNPALIEAGA